MTVYPNTAQRRQILLNNCIWGRGEKGERQLKYKSKKKPQQQQKQTSKQRTNPYQIKECTATLGIKKYQTHLTAQGKLLPKHRPKDQTVVSLPYQMTKLLQLNTPAGKNAAASGCENAEELRSLKARFS